MRFGRELIVDDWWRPRATEVSFEPEIDVTGFQQLMRKPAPPAAARSLFREPERVAAPVAIEEPGFLRRDLAIWARIGRRRALDTLLARRFHGEPAVRPDCALLTSG